jgi:nucleoside-diphosphate-sugar epimerase
MRAFVTGATGFVGVNLVRQLLAEGWDVVALHRSTSSLQDLSGLAIDLVEGSITDPDSLDRAMPDDPDAVFHVAGNTSMWSRRDAEQTRDNVDGARTVAQVALRKRARRFVLTSSIAAYGEHHERIKESTPSTAPSSSINYFRSKYQGEMEVKALISEGLDAVIINPCHIIGPYDRGNWSRLIRLVTEGKLPGVPPGSGSWCHVAEIARAHTAAFHQGCTGENYILGGTDASFLELVQVIGHLTGTKAPERTVPALALKILGRINDLVSAVTGYEPNITSAGAAIACADTLCDCSKAISELGYQPRTIEDMLGDCYKWMVAERLVLKRP